MMEVLFHSETSVLIRAKLPNIQVDGILYSHPRKNIKLYKRSVTIIFLHNLHFIRSHEALTTMQFAIQSPGASARTRKRAEGTIGDVYV
jgi:hypothetical protein